MPGTWQIVLIDDEADIREVVALALADAGYAVRAAENGEAGLALCAASAPQIVITDVRMPGLDGLQVLERLKRLHPEIEVIVATAYGEMPLAVRALQLDASDFITKPIDTETLLLALARARERYTSRQRLKDYLLLLEREHAATSQQLVKTVAFQRSLIENSMDAILGVDELGVAVICNRGLEQLVGRPRELVLNRMRLPEFFVGGGEAERFLEALRGEGYGGPGRLLLFETLLDAASSPPVPVQVSAALLAEGGRESGVVAFFRDLRALRRLERELADQARILHQDKMMSLGRLAASVVHEINNPIAGILNYLRLMGRIAAKGEIAGPRREQFRRHLEICESEAARCSQIVASLLGFSRRSPEKFAPVDTAELLERSILLSRHKLELGKIRLEARIAPGLPAVEGDFNQLQQVLINLIFNAADAMPQGGTLTLAAAPGEAPETVVLSVRDTGPGIPPEHLEAIFEPFFTTKGEGRGLGLGLSTVYGIVARHRGRIEVRNAQGGGALFEITLPARRAA
jgi:signal transduction histidine kinase/CheY-like chemotaxis protein